MENSNTNNTSQSINEILTKAETLSNTDKQLLIQELSKTFTIKERIKSAINTLKTFDYKDKLYIIFNVVPQADFFNCKWRENIQYSFLGLTDNRGNKLHGSDSETHSFKSAKINPTKKSVYKITKSTYIGTFGRLDKNKTFDTKDTLCSIFNEYGSDILHIEIKCDENFEKMYQEKQSLKREKMRNHFQTRDTQTINFDLIQQYNLNFEVKNKADNVILPVNI
jgi:hypothetical protein